MPKPPDGVHVNIQVQNRRCGKPRCRFCKPPATGHGPYIYGYWRDPVTKKLRSTYYGKFQPEQPERGKNDVNRTHHVNQH